MTTMPIFDMADTWNSAGTTFNAIKMNVTDTASAAGSLLMDLQVGGTSQFGVLKNGVVRGVISPDTTTPTYSFDAGKAGLGYLGSTLRLIGGNNALWVNIAADLIQIISSNAAFYFGADTVLTRDAADTLAQRRGTSAQAFRVYRSFTDASNYERLEISSDAIAHKIVGQRAGTGTNRALYLEGNGNVLGLGISPSGAVNWTINSGHFLAGTDNTVDIGASNANRPRNVHVAGYVSIGDGITAPGAGTGQARIYVDAADRDLKCVFADGTVKTIVTDT